MIRILVFIGLLLCSRDVLAQSSFGTEVARLQVDSDKFLQIIQFAKTEDSLPGSNFARSFSFSAVGIPSGSYIEITGIKRNLSPSSENLFFSAALHLRGQAEPKPIAISYFPNQGGFASNVDIIVPHQRLDVAHIYKLKITDDGIRLVRVPSYALAGIKCSQGHDLSSPQHLTLESNSVDSKPSEGSRALPYTYGGGTIELRTDTDTNYVNHYGSVAAANNQIQSVVNSADTMYQSDLNINFSILSQVNNSFHPDTAIEGESLCSVSDVDYGPADDVVLFSGKYLAGNTSVVGLAWLAGICKQARGIGVPCTNQVFLNRTLIRGVNSGAFDHIILAHEVGHNLGADHDTAGNFIMGTTIDAGNLPSVFSTYSKGIFDQIINTGQATTNSGTVNASWACLNSVITPSPTPTPSPIPSPTASPTPGPTVSPTPTPTPFPTQTPGTGTPNPQDPTIPDDEVVISSPATLRVDARRVEDLGRIITRYNIPKIAESLKTLPSEAVSCEVKVVGGFRGGRYLMSDRSFANPLKTVVIKPGHSYSFTTVIPRLPVYDSRRRANPTRYFLGYRYHCFSPRGIVQFGEGYLGRLPTLTANLRWHNGGRTSRTTTSHLQSIAKRYSRFIDLVTRRDV